VLFVTPSSADIIHRPSLKGHFNITSQLYSENCTLATLAFSAQRRASAAPLAGVWSVEDVGQRQVPGNVRAADRWSARSAGSQEAAEGCALWCCQQAVADCRVNCAQPTRRASGVRCTPWLAGLLCLQIC